MHTEATFFYYKNVGKVYRLLLGPRSPVTVAFRRFYKCTIDFHTCIWYAFRSQRKIRVLEHIRFSARILFSFPFICHRLSPVSTSIGTDRPV